jgi:hypothetical protein
MILRFYPTKDATIYERYPNKNTGLDAVLDISKVLNGSTPYNSRVLIDFDWQAINLAIADWGLTNANSTNWKLKMYVTDEQEIPLDYQINCYGLSKPWSMGVGRYGNVPETTEGVSWNYRVGKLDQATSWLTGSYPAGTTGSYQTNSGGGEWNISPEATQTFNYKAGDLSMDVSSVVRPILGISQPSSSSMYGFLLKKTDTDESSTSTFRSIKFFSRDTHTVFAPVLELGYDDSIQSSSLPNINTEEAFNVVAVNMRMDYKESSVQKVRFAARPAYPTTTFVTASGYLERYLLPEGSQYAVYSAQSDDIIIDYSDYTKLSSDDNGNYFRISFENFQPERYYRFVIRVKNDGEAGYQVHDNNWIFKVSRNQ